LKYFAKRLLHVFLTFFAGMTIIVMEGVDMATVFDVAKYFLDELGPMTTWKLQKLCFYAQAWTLAWDGAELFPEEFQAWSNGPVCNELFQKHKGEFNIDSASFPYGNAGVFDEVQRENLKLICEEYGNRDPYWLREQTHGEDPWRNARGTMPVGQPSSAVISKKSMGEYYGSL
jgi:uncharacterized phage-associated protein